MRYLRDGLTVYDKARAQPGFTLFSPLYRTDSFLINMAGEVVHRWETPDRPGDYARLLPNGNLFVSTWAGGGPDGLAARGGRIQEIDWDGKIVWEHFDEFQHHDFRRMENGNTIYLRWETLPDAYARRVKGGLPGTEHPDGIWGDAIREIDGQGRTVWEWHGRDHMDFDAFPLAPAMTRREYAHPNTIVPLADGNVLICFRLIDMAGVIDRATGEFVWMYHHASLGGPHDAQFLPNGNFLIYANGGATRGPLHGSRIVELDPRTKEEVWSFAETPPYAFSSPHISGMQRQPNGNTLICEGMWGRLFEVTPAGEIVWEYVSPFEVAREPGNPFSGARSIFRAFRYAPDSPEIAGRLDGRLG